MCMVSAGQTKEPIYVAMNSGRDTKYECDKLLIYSVFVRQNQLLKRASI